MAWPMPLQEDGISHAGARGFGQEAKGARGSEARVIGSSVPGRANRSGMASLNHASGSGPKADQVVWHGEGNADVALRVGSGGGRGVGSGWVGCM